MRHRIGIAALTCAAALVACGPHEVVFTEPDVPLISVAGYVLIGLDPAYGVVALVDDGGAVVTSDVLTGVKYGMSAQLEAGQVVCGGWAVQALVEDDFGPREARVELADSSGVCVMPGAGRVQHWIQLQLPTRTWEDVFPR